MDEPQELTLPEDIEYDNLPLEATEFRWGAFWRKVALRGILMTAIVGVLGFGSYAFLSSLRPPPEQALDVERVLAVTARAAHPIIRTVSISGYGVARSRDIVPITPEVSGNVVEIHPRLEEGEVIPAGEVLFVIDPRDYEARLREGEASVAQLRKSVERLRSDYAIDRERLERAKRSQELTRKDFDRLKSLLKNDQVGTESNVDAAERMYNSAADLVDQLTQRVNTYPIAIQEAESAVAMAEARLQLAKTSVERTTVKAPFDARIKQVDLEKGQYCSPGRPVLTLADDSLLEISVPLDSTDVRKWLCFQDPEADAQVAWFARPEPVSCDIVWTEEVAEHNSESRWTGTLDRVERFDERTRTMTVVIRVDAAHLLSQTNEGLPLVDGMFCEVRIPGKQVENVFEVPEEAVAFQEDSSGLRKLYLAKQDDTGAYRLRTARVRVSHVEHDRAYIAEGISEGDRVIETRLVDPLEGSLLTIQHEDSPQGAVSE